MHWRKLLSARRLGVKSSDTVTLGRSPFQQDFDRIVFASAFRRLGDKTQVFPLPASDYVRNRLTHSLEAASVGRSLGGIAGAYICANSDVGNIQPSDVGAIVAAAALAHDIGNPPLGHCGEDAIADWFANSPVAIHSRLMMDEWECADIARYEGNAQGFRVLARLEAPEKHGGLQLTCATLGAFAKYPAASLCIKRPQGAAGKKFNFFKADASLFAEVAEATGLLPAGTGNDQAWCRHPLAFLVEAADDLTYRIVDFEDAHRLGIIPYAELEELFLAIISDNRIKEQLAEAEDDFRRTEILRARAIGKLVRECVRAFEKHHDAIMHGDLGQPLIDLIPSAGIMEEIFARSLERIYTDIRAAEVGAAGFELANGLLDAFVATVNDVARSVNSSTPPTARSRKLINLLPSSCRRINDPAWCSSAYVRLIAILDYITSMTDHHAVSLYKKIKGISIASNL